MIGSIDWFGTIFSGPPDGDVTYNTRIAKAMIQEGLAVVLIQPNDKPPACTLTARDAKTANEKARAAAQAAGHPNWDKAKHDCGLHHALTDVTHLNRKRVKELLADGCNLAISFKHTTKPVLVIDVDTADERRAFLDDWALAIMDGTPPELVPDHSYPMTVSSPGSYDIVNGEKVWKHRDGGHFWFTLPEGTELPERNGKLKWCACHGGRKPEDGSPCRNAWVAYWGSGYVLVPPSVRKEGPYRVTGSAPEAPAWLIERISSTVVERTRPPSEGPRFDDDPIDAWSADTPWSEILAEDGFTKFGFDNCGCDTYTRPDNPAHAKSVTAHEVGCAQFSGDRGHNPIHIWSDAIDGPPTQTKLSWIAHQRHNGDTKAAMESLSLRRLGGSEPPALDPFASGEVVTYPKA
jgi:hypothetical protein